MSDVSENDLSPLQRAAREGGMGMWSEDVWRKIDSELPALRGYIAKRKPGSDVPDITQEVLLRLLKASRAGLDEPNNVKAYLCVVAANAVREIARKESVRFLAKLRRVEFKHSRAQPRLPLPSEEDWRPPGEDHSVETIAGRGNDPIAALELDEVISKVGKMKAQYQRVFETRFLQDNNSPETAKLLGVSKSTVKTTIFRIREELKRMQKEKRLLPGAGHRR